MHRPFAVLVVLLAVSVGMACKRGRRSGAETSSPAAQSASLDMPSAGDLDAFVSGAGSIHMGMTEKEVSDALDAKPTRRNAPTQPGGSSDAIWDKTGGAHPGGARGIFMDGRLISIEYVRPGRPDAPQVDRASIQPLLTGATAQASYEGRLRMSDIEAVTRVPGYHLTWAIERRGNGKTNVNSRWIWEVPPGEFLIVEERDGLAHQPVVRPIKFGGNQEEVSAAP